MSDRFHLMCSKLENHLFSTIRPWMHRTSQKQVLKSSWISYWTSSELSYG